MRWRYPKPLGGKATTPSKANGRGEPATAQGRILRASHEGADHSRVRCGSLKGCSAQGGPGARRSTARALALCMDICAGVDRPALPAACLAIFLKAARAEGPPEL